MMIWGEFYNRRFQFLVQRSADHADIISSFDPDTFTFDNDQHEEFLLFFTQL